MKDQLIQEVDSLADGVGEFIKYWGFKKIHGKVWCHLFISQEPLDAAELLERTKVSKAFMSQCLSDLLDYNVILVDPQPSKTKRYRANPSVLNVIFSVLRSREKVMLSGIFASYRNVCSLRKEELDSVGVSYKQLQQLGRMIQLSERFLNSILTLSNFSFQNLEKLFCSRDKTC